VIVTRLSLTDFRNYPSAVINLFVGQNLFVGSNGQGKTNLIESLGYLSTLGSHRVAVDHAMIRKGCDSAIIRAQLESGARELLVEVELNRSGANRAQVNRSVIKTRDLPRYFSSVLFAPEDLALIRGEPSVRRRFLDELMVMRSPRLSAVLADYDRVLRQRNALLKSARASGLRDTGLGTLEIWDDRLIAFGTEIVTARIGLVCDLQPATAASYVAVAGADHHAILANQLTIFATPTGTDVSPARIDAPSVEHRSTATVDEVSVAFRAALARLRRNELDRGMTLVGPHRDDLLLELNGMPAKGYASHGESWSFALALKLAAAQILRRESSIGDPVLMLDDVFAELDVLRRARLAAAIVDFEQVLITAAVLEDVPASLTGNTIRIAAGTIMETL